MQDGEMYVEVEDTQMVNTIAMLNGYMEGALKTYRLLLDEEEKEGAI